MNRCRQCGGPIMFVGTALGKVMPVDPTPNDDGNVAVYRDDRGQLVGHVLGAGGELRRGERRYMPHFASCPARRPAPARVPDGTVSIAAARDQRRRRRYADRHGLDS